jgi:hypothetical protein
MALSSKWSDTLMEKTPAEMPQPDARKPIRMRIRLKHSLPADAEINIVLPVSMNEFDAAYVRGELKELMAKLDDAISEA